MDTITHGLLGAAIASALCPNDGARRRLAIFGALVAAAPDGDLFLSPWIRHRAETHSFFYQILSSPLIALIAGKFFSRPRGCGKTRDCESARAQNPAALSARKPECGFWRLVIITLAGLFSHSILDWFTSWGTRLFLPFSDRIDAADIIAIIDFLFSPPLLLLMILLMFNPYRWAKWQKIFTYAVLGWCGLYLSAGALFAYRVKTNAVMQGAGVIRATPLNGSVFVWRAARVEHERGNAIVAYIDALRGRVVWEQKITFDDTPKTRAMLRSPLMSEWVARSHGVFMMNETSTGEVDFHDLRYGSLTAPRQAFFALRGSFDADGNLIGIARRRISAARVFSVGALAAELRAALKIIFGGALPDSPPPSS